MIMISVGCKWAGPLAICKFCRKKNFLSEKANFSRRKSIFQIKNGDSTFQYAGHNLNGTSDMDTVNSALIINCDKLNRFIGSFNLQYTAFYFFCRGPKGEAMAQCPIPLNTLLYVTQTGTMSVCKQQSLFI